MIRRPVHSPDFAWVEWFFAHAVSFCNHHHAWLLEHPEEFGQVFAAGLLSVTPEYARQYAATLTIMCRALFLSLTSDLR